jgi:phage portal protein BeeE
MGLFTLGRDMKDMEARIEQRIEQIEQKGYYQPNDNEANEYLQRLLRYMAGTIEFKTYERDDLYMAYRTCSAAYGIIDRIARAVGECSAYIELLDENDEPVEEHWILDLLNHPNDRFSRRRFFYAWSTNYDVFGDAFTYMAKEGPGKNFGRPLGLYIPAGNKVGIEHGDVSFVIPGIDIAGDVNKTPIPPTDYFQSFNYNLDDDSYFGFSPLAAAAYEVSLLKKGKERLNTAIDNGGVNAIISPAKDKDGFVVPQAAQMVENELNAAKNFNKTKFLRQPIEVHEIGSKPVDLAILDSGKESVTALCFVYGIPMDLYYGQSKYENAKEAKKALYESAALPRLNIFCEDFMDYLRRVSVGKKTKKPLLDEKEMKYRLAVNTDMIDVLQDDPKDVLTNLTLMNASLNEKREAYGYDRLEGEENPGGIYDKPMLGLGTMFGDEATGNDINENE